jgi:NADH dehydrogenase
LSGVPPILVTGANGQLGRRLLSHLEGLEPPRPTRAVVRSQRAAERLSGEVRVVDYRDTAGLAAAAVGCDAAVHLVGVLKQTRGNRYEDAHENASRALAAAAAQAGLRRVVCVSILGSRPDSDNACLASKGRAEQILLAGKVPALILRVPMVLGPGDPASQALARQARGGRVRLVRGGATREQPIAADDLVRAICAALFRADLEPGAIDLAGPESLTHRELVQRAARVLGTQVEIRSVPLALATAFAWLAERLLAEPPLTRAMLGVLEHDDDIDPTPACRRLGIQLTPLDEALRRALRE